MPNAIELAMQDHRTVEQLFTQFEESGDPAVALQICQELTIHAKVEEELVYPVLAEIDTELEQEAEQEHTEAKQLIAQIEQIGQNGGDQLRELVLQLKQAIEHHVEEEETEAFPKMQESQSPELLDQMGEQIQQRKEELMASGVSGSATTEMTKQELYEEAKDADIPGRSQMNKEELAEAVQENQ
jgi:hemerythrin superfamily protein